MKLSLPRTRRVLVLSATKKPRGFEKEGDIKTNSSRGDYKEREVDDGTEVLQALR